MWRDHIFSQRSTEIKRAGKRKRLDKIWRKGGTRNKNFFKLYYISLKFFAPQFDRTTAQFECWYIMNTIFSVTRGSRLELFCKNGVLKNFVKTTGKHLCRSLFFNNVSGLPTRVLEFTLRFIIYCKKKVIKSDLC